MSEELKPFTKKQIYDELRDNTLNFTDESGECNYAFESECKFAYNILMNKYEEVDYWFDDDWFSPTGESWHLTFSGPTKGKKKVKELLDLEISSYKQLANVYNKSGELLYQKAFRSRAELDNFVNTLNVFDMASDKNNQEYKGKLFGGQVWKVVVEDELKESANDSLLGKEVTYKGKKHTIKDIENNNGNIVFRLDDNSLFGIVAFKSGLAKTDDKDVKAYVKANLKVEEPKKAEPKENPQEREAREKNEVIAQALKDARDDYDKYKKNSPMIDAIKKARKSNNYERVPTMYPELYADTYFKEFMRIKNSVEGKVSREYFGIIEKTYSGDVDSLIKWLRDAITNITVSSGDTLMRVTQERVDYLNDRDNTNVEVSYQSSKQWSSWLADITTKEDILKDMPKEFRTWRIEKNSGKSIDDRDVGLVYNERQNTISSNPVVLDLLFEFKFKLGKQSTSAKENLDESNDNEEVELHYPELTIERVVDSYEQSYNSMWGGWEPGGGDTIEVDIEYDYYVSKREIKWLLWDLLEDRDEFIDMSEEEFKKYLDDNFDELFEEYEVEILEYYEDKARDEAERNCCESLNESKDDDVVEETNEYKIVKTISKTYRTKNGVAVGKPKEKTIYQVYFRTQDFNPATNRWMNKGWSLSTSDFDTLEDARAFVKKYGKTLKDDLDEDIEKHDELNPKLFDGEELKPEVKEAIQKIADEFIKELNEDEVNFTLKDIVLLGSNVSYNYTKDSDLDIHLIADSNALDCPEALLDKLYGAYRSIFNKNYEITIKDIPAEIYVELDEPKAKSNGIYSLNNGWIKKPEASDIPDLDEEAFNNLFTIWEDDYFDLLDRESTSDEVAQFIENIYELRKESIAEDGEYSLGNLVFKEFRNLGYLDKLKDLRKELKGKELSLEHLEEDLISDEESFWNMRETCSKLAGDKYDEVNLILDNGEIRPITKEELANKFAVSIEQESEKDYKTPEELKAFAQETGAERIMFFVYKGTYGGEYSFLYSGDNLEEVEDKVYNIAKEHNQKAYAMYDDNGNYHEVRV